MRTRFGLVVALAIATGTISAGLSGPAAAQANFNGPYVGAVGGYGWGTSTQTGAVPPQVTPLFDCGFGGIFVSNPQDCPSDDAKLRTKGGLIGGVLGWNAQYGAWLFGIEGDYSYAALTGQSNTCGTIPHTCGTRLESLGTVRGRVGTFVNDWLVYATGGWAFGEVSGFSVAKSSGQAMYSGWTLGGGIEKRFAPQWSLKLEYLYADLGDKDLYQATVPGYPEHIAYKVNTLRIGLNYFFEPVAAPVRSPIITKGPALK